MGFGVQTSPVGPGTKPQQGSDDRVGSLGAKAGLASHKSESALGLRAALYQNAFTKRMKRGMVYRTRSQSISGSEEAPSSPLAGFGAPGPKTILLLSKTDRMPILDRKLDLSLIHISEPTRPY